MLSGGLEYSAGGVILGPDALLALSTHRKTGISLPKGHVEEGESPRQAALREFREEVGLTRVTVACQLGTFTRVGEPTFKGHALAAAVTAALPDGIVEFEGRTDTGRKKLNRRYVVQRRPNGDLYLHVEWPQKSADVLMRFWKPADGAWTAATYAWTRKGGGWRRITADEEKFVRKELPNIQLTPRGDIPVLADLAQPGGDEWVCEFGTITRKVVTGRVGEDQRTQEHRWSFVPRGPFAAQAFPALNDLSSSADLLRLLRWNVVEGPTFTADPVLARFRPLDAGKSRDSEFKVIDWILGTTRQEVLRPTDDKHTAAGWYPLDEAHALLSTVRPVDAKQLLVHRHGIEQLQAQILGARRGAHRTPRRTRHAAIGRPARAQVIAA